MSLTFTGQAGIARELDRFSRDLRARAKQGLIVEAGLVGDAVDEIVPVASGDLRDSKQLTTRGETGVIDAVVSYGGQAAPYAVLVHERTSTGRKFLEIPLMAAERGFLARLGKHLKIG